MRGKKENWWSFGASWLPDQLYPNLAIQRKKNPFFKKCYSGLPKKQTPRYNEIHKSFVLGDVHRDMGGAQAGSESIALRASQPQNEIDQRHLGGNDRDCPAVWGGYHKAGSESLSCSWLTGVSHISQEPCLLMFMLGSVCPVLYHQRHSLAEPWVSLRQKENQRYHFWLYWKCFYCYKNTKYYLKYII